MMEKCCEWAHGEGEGLKEIRRGKRERQDMQENGKQEDTEKK